VFTAVKQYFKPVRDAFVSIFEGMAVTFSYLFRKPITIQYPDRTPKPVAQMLTPGFRGILEVDPTICIGDLLCMRRCPIGVIKIEIERDPETKTVYLNRFDIDIARCMVCGLCTEVCQTSAIRHSTEFEASTASVINLVLRYIEPGQKVPAYRINKEVEPQGLPQNEPYQRIKKEWNAPAPLSPDVVRGRSRWKPAPLKEETK
jgi:formate hydrogenlyase subunit 6/NADH:ubiquinone oxidoreductase subunit I